MRADFSSSAAPSAADYPPFEVLSNADELADKAYAILKENCMGCHGANKRSGLDMRTNDSLQAGGNSGKVRAVRRPKRARP